MKTYDQNRRQKFFNRELCVCSGGFALCEGV